MNQAKCYVYEDRKPCGEVFYVGIGSARRLKKVDRNKWHSNIVKKYPNWTRVVIASMFSFDDAKRIEIERIAEYGRRDKQAGHLVNLTDGGDGTLGYVFSEESLKKKSEATRMAMAKPESIEKRSKITKAFIANPEIKRKQIDGLNLYFAKPETKEKIRLMFDSESYRNKHSEAVKKSWDNECRRSKLSEVIANTWDDGDIRKKRIYGIKKQLEGLTKCELKLKVSAMQTPESVAKNREAIRIAFSNPETRKRQLEASQAAFKRPEVIAKKAKSISEVWNKRRLWANENGYIGKLNRITLDMMEK